VKDIARALDAAAQAINCANVNAAGLENPEGVARAAIVGFLRALPSDWRVSAPAMWHSSSVAELADAIEAETRKGIGWVDETLGGPTTAGWSKCPDCGNPKRMPKP